MRSIVQLPAAPRHASDSPGHRRRCRHCRLPSTGITLSCQGAQISRALRAPPWQRFWRDHVGMWSSREADCSSACMRHGAPTPGTHSRPRCTVPTCPGLRDPCPADPRRRSACAADLKAKDRRTAEEPLRSSRGRALGTGAGERSGGGATSRRAPPCDACTAAGGRPRRGAGALIWSRRSYASSTPSATLTKRGVEEGQGVWHTLGTAGVARRPTRNSRVSQSVAGQLQPKLTGPGPLDLTSWVTRPR